MNETQAPVVDLEPTTSELIEMFYQLSFFLVGTPINIAAFVKTKKHMREGGMESRLLRLSRQLLIAHLLVLSIYGVWRSYWFYNIVWTQGDFLCKVFSFMTALPFHLWSNLVAAIAIDMLFCITSPLNSYRTAEHRVTSLIAVSWGAAIICSVPMLIIRGTIKIGANGEDGEFEQCYPLVNVYSPEALIAFSVFHVLTSFYIPLLIVIICYSIIGFSLRRQMAERKTLHTERGVHYLAVDANGSQKKKKHNCAKARFFRATAAIIATFVITWLPYQVLALVRVTCEEDGVCQRITSKLTWLQAIIIASTCINPFLYRFGEGHKKSKSCTNTETALRTNNSYSIKRTRSNSSTHFPLENGERKVLKPGRYIPDRPTVNEN